MYENSDSTKETHLMPGIGPIDIELGNVSYPGGRYQSRRKSQWEWLREKILTDILPLAMANDEGWFAYRFTLPNKQVMLAAQAVANGMNRTNKVKVTQKLEYPWRIDTRSQPIKNGRYWLWIRVYNETQVY